MLAAARAFNALITGLFDLLFWPLARLGPTAALVMVSAASGVALLWIFGRVSDQPAIKAVRDRIRGNLIAAWLFGEDVGLLLRLQGRLLRDNVVFLRHALGPLLLLLAPVALLLVQLDLRFGARPLAPGEEALVKVHLRQTGAIDAGVELEAPQGVSVETRPVRIAALGEVVWRVRARTPGSHRLVVRAGGERLEKSLEVGGGWRRTSALRAGRLSQLLLHPGEPPIDARSPVESIEVRYDRLPLALNLDWLVWFLALSLAAGFALRKPLGVEI
jgi:hypothetical protein